ncbi:DUF6446 family protein [uncultured Maritimibacter sp.]|uniref:DUF6446 family protein n=1 Tax=uncultured Maritimibacter sp. TaxID=991866 RepID=UPI002596EE64|nr:DUF6446 family protein [uncultured Maritimibacter sp.]
MNGKLVAGFIVVVTLIFGIVLYYTQVYAYYDRVNAEEVSFTMVNISTGLAEPIIADDIEAIDGSSSPIRFRACFTAGMSSPTMQETYVAYPEPTPLNAPGWFDCFDAQEIGTDLEDGQAVAFLSEKNIHDGVDRVIAVYPDGRAFAWHQLNEKFNDEGSEPIQ